MKYNQKTKPLLLEQEDQEDDVCGRIRKKRRHKETKQEVGNDSSCVSQLSMQETKKKRKEKRWDSEIGSARESPNDGSAVVPSSVHRKHNRREHWDAQYLPLHEEETPEPTVSRKKAEHRVSVPQDDSSDSEAKFLSGENETGALDHEELEAKHVKKRKKKKKKQHKSSKKQEDDMVAYEAEDRLEPVVNAEPTKSKKKKRRDKDAGIHEFQEEGDLANFIELPAAKRRKHKDKNRTNHESDSDFVGDVVDLAVGKQKEQSRRDETVGTMQGDSDLRAVEINSSRKKKKKRRDKDMTTQKSQENLDPTSTHDSLMTKEKNHRNEHRSVYKALNDSDLAPDFDSPVRKQKKHRNREATMDATHEGSDPVSDMLYSVPWYKKKHRKREAMMNTMHEDSDLVSDALGSVPRSKKKHRNREAMTDATHEGFDGVSDVLDSVPKNKKKHKNREATTDTTHKGFDPVSCELDIAPKEKKKHKNRDKTVDVMQEDTGLFDDEINLPAKKKKKHKNQDLSLDTVQEGLDFADTINLSPKKRKKHKAVETTQEGLGLDADVADKLERKKKRHRVEEASNQAGDSGSYPDQRKYSLEKAKQKRVRFDSISQAVDEYLGSACDSDTNDLRKVKKSSHRGGNEEKGSSQQLDSPLGRELVTTKSSQKKLKSKNDFIDQMSSDVHVRYDAVGDEVISKKKKHKHKDIYEESLAQEFGLDDTESTSGSMKTAGKSRKSKHQTIFIDELAETRDVDLGAGSEDTVQNRKKNKNRAAIEKYQENFNVASHEEVQEVTKRKKHRRWDTVDVASLEEDTELHGAQVEAEVCLSKKKKRKSRDTPGEHLGSEPDALALVTSSSTKENKHVAVSEKEPTVDDYARFHVDYVEKRASKKHKKRRKEMPADEDQSVQVDNLEEQDTRETSKKRKRKHHREVVSLEETAEVELEPSVGSASLRRQKKNKQSSSSHIPEQNDHKVDSSLGGKRKSKEVPGSRNNLWSDAHFSEYVSELVDSSPRKGAELISNYVQNVNTERECSLLHTSSEQEDSSFGVMRSPKISSGASSVPNSRKKSINSTTECINSSVGRNIEEENCSENGSFSSKFDALEGAREPVNLEQQPTTSLSGANGKVPAGTAFYRPKVSEQQSATLDNQDGSIVTSMADTTVADNSNVDEPFNLAGRVSSPAIVTAGSSQTRQRVSDSPALAGTFSNAEGGSFRTLTVPSTSNSKESTPQPLTPANHSREQSPPVFEEKDSLSDSEALAPQAATTVDATGASDQCLPARTSNAPSLPLGVSASHNSAPDASSLSTVTIGKSLRPQRRKSVRAMETSMSFNDFLGTYIFDAETVEGNMDSAKDSRCDPKIIPEHIKKEKDQECSTDLAETPHNGKPDSSTFRDDCDSDSPVDDDFMAYVLNPGECPAIHRNVCTVDKETKRQYEEQTGRKIENGRYTYAEDEILKRNYRNITKFYKLRYPYMLVGLRGDESVETFKSERARMRQEKMLRLLGKGLENRTAMSYYMRGRALFNPTRRPRKQSTFTAEEEDTMRELHSTLGPQWIEIGRRMGKNPGTVRSVFRKLQNYRDKKTGKWSKDEVARLEEAIRAQVGDDLGDTSEVCWKTVAKHVVSRNNMQCWHRWSVTQRMRPSKDKKGRRKWNDNNNIHLIHVMYHKNFSSENHVDWKALMQEEFPWASSPLYLKKQWRTLTWHVPRHVPPGLKERVNFLYHTYIHILLAKKYSAKTAEDAVLLSKYNTLCPEIIRNMESDKLDH